MKHTQRPHAGSRDVQHAWGKELVDDHSIAVSTLTGSAWPGGEEEDRWLAPPTSTATLFGREKEQKLLFDAHNRASRGSSEICFVSGESGVGKSSLVESLRGAIASKGQGYFVSGKFDQLQKDPYSALVAAFSDLVDLITQAGRLKQLLADLEELVGSDMGILTTLISNLPLPSHLQKNRAEEQDNVNQAFTRLKRLSRSFLQAASSPDHPILLLLDDLQWCDTSSREVIKAIMADLNSKHVLLVGTFRVDQDSQGVRELLLGAAPQTSLLPLTEIKLTNLDESSIAVLVSDMMNGLECVNEVAAILKSKTGGNPYFLLRFLEMARDNELLQMSEPGTWVCDMERFQNETHVSENLADLVSSRLRTLEPKVLDLLMVASALGYLLDSDLLYRVAVSEGIVDVSEQNKMGAMLQTATKHGFIESSRGMCDFKFTHDRVQSCLYSLFDSEEQREALHLRVGKLLLQRSKEIPNDAKVVFYAVEQWNRGSALAMNNIRDQEALVQVNFLAAGMAIAKSSFSQGCEYYSIAAELMDPDELWTSRHDFAVDLLSSYAEALNHNGSYAECIGCCEEILVRASSTQEKLRAYWAMATALSGQGRTREAVDVGILVLKKLGVRIPRRPTMINAAVEIVKTRKAMKSKTEEDILNLPLMTDWRKVAAMKMMSKIILLIYLNYSEKNAFVVVGLRMVLLSCKYGLTSMTPYGLANYALVYSILGRYDEACRIGRIALNLIEKLGARDSEASTNVMLNLFVFHWRVPTLRCAQELQRAYVIGRETGDLEFAYVAAIGFIAFSFHECESLYDLEAEGRTLCQVLDDFPHELASMMIRPFLQGVQNLMGMCDCPWILTGDVLNEAEWEAAVNKENNPLMDHNVGFLKIYYAFEFGATDRMLEALSQADVDEVAIRGSCYQYLSKWICGLVLFGLYRSTGKPSFKRRALKHCRALRKWSLSGVDNCTPFYYLLDAERLSLSDAGAAKVAYDKVIGCSVERKMHLYQAIVSECAGMAFFYHDTTIAREYLVSALELWKQLGGAAKVQHIEAKLVDLPDAHAGITNSEEQKSQPGVVWVDVSSVQN